jgi:hypothetical protein
VLGSLYFERAFFLAPIKETQPVNSEPILPAEGSPEPEASLILEDIETALQEAAPADSTERSVLKVAKDVFATVIASDDLAARIRSTAVNEERKIYHGFLKGLSNQYDEGSTGREAVEKVFAFLRARSANDGL